MDALVLDRINVSRGARPILHDFTMVLPPGVHHIILGASGAGKSTLLGIICGILTPDAGQVLFYGEDVTKLPSAARDRHRATHMGVVFQNLGLASALSVDANLALAQRMAGKAQDPAFGQALLRRLGLAGRGHAKPRQLSRGEAQRAAIARALIVRPKLLVADEPTASLDAAWRDTVMDIVFEQAARDDMTLLVSTHDLSVAKRFDQQTTLPQERTA